MKPKLTLLILAALAIVLLTNTGMAQMSGTTYKISIGNVAGGGGASASTAYTLTGVVPLVGGGVIASTTYSITGGTTGIIYGGMTTLKTMYSGSAEATVNKENRLLKVAYSGSSGTAAGVIYYRQGGASAFQSADMAAGTGDTLTYNLPASLLDIRGLEYYFEVTRDIYMSRIGSPTDPLVFNVSLTNDQAQKPNATPVKSYRMIGVPINVSGSNTVATVFEDDLGVYNTSKWRIGRYVAGAVQEFNNAGPVIPGRGYWLITAEAETFGAPGVSVRPNRTYNSVDYYEVPLSQGWNQLANPFGFRVAWDEILFEVGGIVQTGHPAEVLEDVAYGYTGTGYESWAAIPYWEGVFVRINQNNVTALIPFKMTSVTPKVSPSKDEPLFSSSFWNIEIKMKSGDFVDTDNFAGVRADALEGPDIYDFSEPPPAPTAPSLGFLIPDDDGRLRRVDYRPPTDKGASWEIQISQATDRKLTFLGLDRVPVDMEAWLFTDDGKKYDLYKDSEINLPERVTSAKLIIGNKSYTQDELSSILPIDFELEQNFPNPFNPLTTIKFALPKNGMTTLEIFNVLGQRVRTLIDRELPAGYHTVTWNGEDNNGKESASGVYFYRLVSGGRSAYKKMMLVK